MTSKITIEAHCGPSKEVRYVIGDAKTGVEIDEKILKDGEKAEVYVYDDRFVGVMEMPREIARTVETLIAAQSPDSDVQTPWPRYRKKPVVIDAVRLEERMMWPDWFHDAVTRNDIIVHNVGKFRCPCEETYVEIKTMEGVMRGDVGDWVLKGVQGEIYPCKAGIFAATYDTIEGEG